jgi:membrane-bound ClpP family serine protease
MWVVAGILLGLVVLASLVGFHTGPHSHVAAGVIGLVAAAWLVVMALVGQSAPLLWALLSADLVVSAGIGVMGWFGLTHRASGIHHLRGLEAAEGVAMSDLDPDGIVRVRGEQWSARSVNGRVRAGGRVQVIGVSGVHLEVWAEEPLPEPNDGQPELDAGGNRETGT